MMIHQEDIKKQTVCSMCTRLPTQYACMYVLVYKIYCMSYTHKSKILTKEFATRKHRKESNQF